MEFDRLTKENLAQAADKVEAVEVGNVLKQVQQISPWQLRIRERRILLFIGDLVMASISMGIALVYWGYSARFADFTLKFFKTFLQNRVPVWFYLLPLIWMLLLVELYDLHQASDWRRTLRGVAMAALAGLVLYLFFYFFYVTSPDSLLPRLGVATFLLSVSLLTLVWRGVYIRVFTASRFMRRALLVGGGRAGEILLQVLKGLPARPFILAGVIDDDHRKLATEIEACPVIGTSEQLLKIINEQSISDVIVAITGEMQGNMFQALLDAQEMGVEISRMAVIYEELLGRVPIRLLETNWILRSFVDDARTSIFYQMGKRLLDIIGGLFGTLMLVLVLPFVGLAILLDDGFPVFYAQTRSGRGGQPYRILKFRTMRRDAEPDGRPQWAKEDDERATRTGRFLRKTHVDELPQFLNVLRGEMSMVGPRAERPELVQMFQKHVPFYRARLLVKPGITGWAQVNFGYAATIDETIIKLEYDLYYIKHRSMLMDVVILLRTPATVLGFRGR